MLYPLCILIKIVFAFVSLIPVIHFLASKNILEQEYLLKII